MKNHAQTLNCTSIGFLAQLSAQLEHKNPVLGHFR